MARISDVPLVPCSSAYNPRTVPFTKAWPPEPHGPKPEPGRKQRFGIVRRMTRRVRSRPDMLREWLRYKAKARNW
jgi:hypothetical protein